MSLLIEKLLDQPTNLMAKPLLYQLRDPDIAGRFISEYQQGPLLTDLASEINLWTDEVSFALSALVDLSKASATFCEAFSRSSAAKFLIARAFGDYPRVKRSLAVRTLVKIKSPSLDEAILSEMDRMNLEYPLLLGDLFLEAHLENKLHGLIRREPVNGWHPILRPMLLRLTTADSSRPQGIDPAFSFVSRVVGLIESELESGVLSASSVESLIPFIERAHHLSRCANPITACPACGYKSLFKDPGAFEVCAVCGWIDDLIRRVSPQFCYGRRGLSLSEKVALVSSKGNEALIEACKQAGVSRTRALNPQKHLSSLANCAQNNGMPTLERCLETLAALKENS